MKIGWFMSPLQYLKECKDRRKYSISSASHWIVGELLIKNDKVPLTLIKTKYGIKDRALRHALMQLKELGFDIGKTKRGKHSYYFLKGVRMPEKQYLVARSKKDDLWRLALSI